MISPFSSLQARLVFAFVLVTAVALSVAGGVFVAATRDDQERQELDRVAALSPAIVSELFREAAFGPGSFDLDRFAYEAAAQHKVRIVALGAGGIVSADSEGRLVGQELGLPGQGQLRLSDAGEPYLAFQSANSLADDTVFVEAALPVAGTFALGSATTASRLPAERLVLAVPESTVTRAWLNLLPALGVAAGVAFPVAIGLAVWLARSIARPVQQLTLASQQLSEGSFSVDLQTGREDEIGRLADAFSTMATRVGTSHTQMRQLIANVSHDLKTPLTSIVGFSRALSSGAARDEAEVRHMGAVIEEEAARLSSRLNDLLYLSELDSGRAVVEWHDIDLARVATGVLDRLLPDGDRRRGPVEITPGLSVSADSPKLERVLENLIGNAVKFTSTGGEIRVRAFTEPGRPGVCFEMSNTAPDVAEEDLARLFDRFHRGDRARRSTDGSGLGLAIARDLTRLMHGALDARLEGEVLTFRLRLKAAAGPGRHVQ